LTGAYLPLSACPQSDLSQAEAVLCDIDDTLTTHGRLPAVAYDALERLHEAGLIVIPVTGRPAGWCDHIARMWPVNGVVGENGAFAFCYDDHEKRMLRLYAQGAEIREANGAKLRRIADHVLATFPGTAIASDQAYREIDIAVDFREDVPPLPLETAEAIRKAFEREGATAKVSSIHVNAWFGNHDKLSMALKLLGDMAREKVFYAGDSPNDAPMFAAFRNSVGVANVLAYRDIMPSPPHYVTNREGGQGFAELADAILDARRR
jgi:HAD superfamily hydrolase (TIGR01484 family)